MTRARDLELRFEFNIQYPDYGRKNRARLGIRRRFDSKFYCDSGTRKRKIAGRAYRFVAAAFYHSGNQSQKMVVTDRACFVGQLLTYESVEVEQTRGIDMLAVVWLTQLQRSMVVELMAVLLLVAEIKPMIELEPDAGLRRGVVEARRLVLPTRPSDVAVVQHVLVPVAELLPHPLRRDIAALLLKPSNKK